MMMGKLDIEARREGAQAKSEQDERGMILALRDMADENQRLAETVGKLAHRLDDLLRDEPPSKCEAEPDVPGGSPLSRMIWQQILVSRSIRDRVEDLLERLDL